MCVRLVHQPTANSHQQSNLKNWFFNHQKAIDDEEQHFLEEDRLGDLFPIVSKPKTPLGTLSSKVRLLRRPFNLKQKSPDRVDSPTAHYHSGTGFDIVFSIVIVVVGLGSSLGQCCG